MANFSLPSGWQLAPGQISSWTDVTGGDPAEDAAFNKSQRQAAANPDLIGPDGQVWMVRDTPDGSPLSPAAAQMYANSQTINGLTYVPRSIATSQAVTGNLSGLADLARGAAFPLAAFGAGQLGSALSGGSSLFGGGSSPLSIGNAPGINLPGSGFLNVSADAADAGTSAAGGLGMSQNQIVALERAGTAAGLSGNDLDSFIMANAGQTNQITMNALTQLGQSAGLSGPELDNFVTSGGAGATGSALSGLSDSVPKSAAGSALSRILSGNGTSDDYLKTLGTIGQAGAGIFAGLNQANTIKGIADQARADRLPALNAFNSALANPDTFYNSAPAMGGLDAVQLRKLSTQGNPAADPGSLSKASAYNLGQYNDYLKSLSGPAFGTAGTEANINLQGAAAQGGAYEAAGSGLQNLLNPPQKYTLNLGNLLS